MSWPQPEMFIPFHFNKVIHDISFISLLAFISDLNTTTTTTTTNNNKFSENITDDGHLWREKNLDSQNLCTCWPLYLPLLKLFWVGKDNTCGLFA